MSAKDKDRRHIQLYPTPFLGLGLQWRSDPVWQDFPIQFVILLPFLWIQIGIGECVWKEDLDNA